MVLESKALALGNDFGIQSFSFGTVPKAEALDSKTNFLVDSFPTSSLGMHIVTLSRHTL
jgi:hypothetical protein